MSKLWGRLFSLPAICVLYFLALLPLLPVLSLWLDEILELHGLRDLPVSRLPAYIASNAGAVPLGYLPQLLLIRLLGYSPATGRLASAVFAALACYTLGLLCRRLHIRYPLLAVAIFALCPIQLRYATEARTYSQAIFLSILCTLIFTHLLERPTAPRWLLYFLTMVAGLYTQPYTLFVPLAHCLWLLVERRRMLPQAAGLTVLAGACFAPWYLYATTFWRANVTQEHIRFVFRAKELALIAHEIAGAGYIGTALLLIACAAALRVRYGKLLLALIAIPFIGPIAADSAFGYFFASRQLLFMLPALCILAAAGVTILIEQKHLMGCVLTGALAVSWIAGDIRWFTKPREDWSSPALTLAQQLGNDGCVQFIPANSQVYYTFFAPALANRTCGAAPPNQVWLAVSPYDTEPEYSRAIRRLNTQNYSVKSPGGVERPHLELFTR